MLHVRKNKKQDLDFDVPPHYEPKCRRPLTPHLLLKKAQETTDIEEIEDDFYK